MLFDRTLCSPQKERNENFVKKICRFVDIEFVNTCDEFIIEREKYPGSNSRRRIGSGQFQRSRTCGLLGKFYKRNQQYLVNQ